MKVGGEGMWARGVEFGAGNGVGPRSRMRASFERKMRRRVRCQGAPKVWASMEREVQEYPRAEADRWRFRRALALEAKGRPGGQSMMVMSPPVRERSAQSRNFAERLSERELDWEMGGCENHVMFGVESLGAAVKPPRAVAMGRVISYPHAAEDRRVKGWPRHTSVRRTSSGPGGVWSLGGDGIEVVGGRWSVPGEASGPGSLEGEWTGQVQDGMEIDELEGVEVGPGRVVGSEALVGAVGVAWSLVGGLGSSHLGLAASS